MYKELEGKIIGCSYDEDDLFIVKGVVVGCDFDIGITIMENNLDKYYMCLAGPSSPLWKGNFNKFNYKRAFDVTVEMIKSGKYFYNKTVIAYFGEFIHTGVASAEYCSFNQ